MKEEVSLSYKKKNFTKYSRLEPNFKRLSWIGRFDYPRPDPLENMAHIQKGQKGSVQNQQVH